MFRQLFFWPKIKEADGVLPGGSAEIELIFNSFQ
jgi:hypothetical protein